VVQTLLEGWSVNGITSYQSGDPLNIMVASSQLNTGTGNFADVTCNDIRVVGEVNQWFDTACFANPAPFKFGNYKIGMVRGPKYVNTDFSIFKRSALGADRTIEGRFEILNLFNKAHSLTAPIARWSGAPGSGDRGSARNDAGTARDRPPAGSADGQPASSRWPR
jgi:hypothetical protein